MPACCPTGLQTQNSYLGCAARTDTHTQVDIQCLQAGLLAGLCDRVGSTSLTWEPQSFCPHPRHIVTAQPEPKNGLNTLVQQWQPRGSLAVDAYRPSKPSIVCAQPGLTLLRVSWSVDREILPTRCNPLSISVMEVT